MAYLPRLIFRNLLRHPLRTLLTAIGIVVAITAFGLLRTTVDAWYAGVEASSSSRLVTRNKNSLVFPLPLHYLNKIRQVGGVSQVSYAEWFGGIYIDKKNFFPQFAVDGHTYFKLYPEFVVPPEQLRSFSLDRRGVIVGRKTAAQYGWKIGDQIPLQGTIYPGTWDFVIEGIYRGIDSKTDETQFFFHWDYLNEITKKTNPDNADKIGIFLVGLKHAQDAPLIAQHIDAMFANSLAETLTETEKAFQLSFVAMTEAILLVIQAVSFLIILIIMAVMANTMAMTARERRGEYAILKAMGFPARFIVGLILGESLLLSLSAGAAGIVLIFPTARDVGARFGTLFPIFNVSAQTIWMAAGAALLVGVVAAVVPAWRAAHIPIAEGMRGVV
ncbi:MAG TPA: FtsX-like permease family protein [Gammaproteobacteria bacterium]|nr:FtsX-like permease family protein [Gammaproteobacteria bacterium]